MGKEKGGFLTPKAIANRIKAKGLQKLRWYCQMCQKQCRDENGFKCHLTSESHQRQLLLFAENPDRYIDTFSEEFKDEYMELLKRRFGTKRVHCNIVYQEYISDREHVHMNSTQWETLTDFIKWLGKEGIAKVDETEKGWYVQYIDRDPETLKKNAAHEKKEKMDLDDQERAQKFLLQQIERANAAVPDKPLVEATELQRENEEEKVTFSFGQSFKKTEEAAKPSTSSNPLEEIAKTSESKPKDGKPKKEGSQVAGEKRKAAHALDEIMKMEEEKKEKMNRKDYWLHPGIVVKIVTKKLGEKYHKKKAVIREVKDNYIAIVKLLESGDKLKVDQAHLETVIPAIGKLVLVINGAYRGSEAWLKYIDEKKFCCSIEIKSGPLKGRVVEKVQYEDISKIHTG